MEDKIKVKVLKPFINKYSKQVVEEGKIIEITEKRLKEIEEISLELVQVIEDEVEEEKETTETENQE